MTRSAPHDGKNLYYLPTAYQVTRAVNMSSAVLSQISRAFVSLEAFNDHSQYEYGQRRGTECIEFQKLDSTCNSYSKDYDSLQVLETNDNQCLVGPRDLEDSRPPC